MNENASGKNILARLECDNGTLAARIITRHGQPAAIGFDYDSDGILIDGLSSGFLAIADDRFDRRNQEHCQSFERWEARCRAGGRGGATLSVHANDTNGNPAHIHIIRFPYKKRINPGVYLSFSDTCDDADAVAFADTVLGYARSVAAAWASREKEELA